MRPARLVIGFCLILALSGCVTAGEHQVDVKLVNVPTPIPCTPDVGSEPAYPDTPEALNAATDIFERVKLLLEGRIKRQQRLAVLNAAVSACASVGRVPPPK